MDRRSPVSWLLPFAIASVLLLGSALAAPGDLDPSFGQGGKSAPELPMKRVETRASDVLVQPDGKVVAAIDPNVVRLLPDGTPDPGFGDDGVVDSPVGAVAIALQSDGRIVVGSSGGVARFDADGTLDSTFGRNGVAPLLHEGGGPGIGYDHLSAGAIAVRSDGKIIVAGHVLFCRDPRLGRNPTLGPVCDPHGALGLYNGDGSIAGGFGGGDGVATATDTAGFIGVAVHDDRISTLAARQLVGGEFRADQVFAYGPAGTPDPSFGGGDGRAPVPVLGNGNAISVLSSGALLVAGRTADGGVNSDLLLARLSSSGDADPGFGGGDGVVTTDFGAGDEALALATDGDGRIVLGGTTRSSACFGTSTDGCKVDLALARYTPDGSPDASFGSGGLVKAPLAGPSGTAVLSLAVDTDGRTLAGGEIHPAEADRFGAMIARYLVGGSLDPGFGGGDGIVIKEGRAPSSVAGTDAALQRDGKVVVVGQSDADATAPSLTVARYLPNGALDRSFAGGDGVFSGLPGAVADPVAIQADGGILVGLRGGFAFARLTPEGSLDSSFGPDGDGIVRSPAGEALGTEIALQADGRIVAAGLRFTGRHPAFLARYRQDGTLDPSFGGDGVVSTPIGSEALAVQRDGKIVGGGTTSKGIFFARYRKDGRLDRSFGGDGLVGSSAVRDGGFDDPRGSTDLVIQPSGKLVAVTPLGLVHFRRDGTRDRRFGGRANGVARLGLGYEEIGRLAVQKDGRIVLAGWRRDPVSQKVNFGVTRYRPDGTLDPSFGNGGRIVTSFAPDFTAGAEAPLVQADGRIVVVGDAFAADFGSSRFALARYSSGSPVR